MALAITSAQPARGVGASQRRCTRLVRRQHGGPSTLSRSTPAPHPPMESWAYTVPCTCFGCAGPLDEALQTWPSCAMSCDMGYCAVAALPLAGCAGHPDHPRAPACWERRAYRYVAQRLPRSWPWQTMRSTSSSATVTPPLLLATLETQRDCMRTPPWTFKGAPLRLCDAFCAHWLQGAAGGATRAATQTVQQCRCWGSTLFSVLCKLEAASVVAVSGALWRRQIRYAPALGSPGLFRRPTAD